MVSARGRRRSQEGWGSRKERGSRKGRGSQERWGSQKGRKSQKGRGSQERWGSQKGRRLKSHGRRSAAKQKTRAQAKRRPAKKKRSLKGSFRSDNAKTLEKIKGVGGFLSQQAKGLMVNFMEDVYKVVSKEAERLRKESREPLIGPAHVEAALRLVVPKRRWKKVFTVASRSRN